MGVTDREQQTHCVLCCTQSCRDGDLSEVRAPGLLPEEVENGLGRIGRRPTSNANDDVRSGILENLHALLNPRDRSMFVDLVKRSAIRITLFQDVLYLLYDIRLERAK